MRESDKDNRAMGTKLHAMINKTWTACWDNLNKLCMLVHRVHYHVLQNCWTSCFPCCQTALLTNESCGDPLSFFPHHKKAIGFLLVEDIRWLRMNLIGGRLKWNPCSDFGVCIVICFPLSRVYVSIVYCALPCTTNFYGTSSHYHFCFILIKHGHLDGFAMLYSSTLVGCCLTGHANLP